MTNPWHTELSDWDRSLLALYPYKCDITHVNQFMGAIDWCYLHCDIDSYTWKGPRFFFKRERDYLMFTLKYA